VTEQEALHKGMEEESRTLRRAAENLNSQFRLSKPTSSVTFSTARRANCLFASVAVCSRARILTKKDDRRKCGRRNEHYFFLETTVPGSFAAGDVRHGSAKRNATAVREGGIAVKFVNHILEQET